MRESLAYTDSIIEPLDEVCDVKIAHEMSDAQALAHHAASSYRSSRSQVSGATLDVIAKAWLQKVSHRTPILNARLLASRETVDAEYLSIIKYESADSLSVD